MRLGVGLALVTAGLAGALLIGPAEAGAESDRALIAQLDREVIALRQKIERLEGEVANCGSGEDAGRVYPELVQVFAGGPVSVDRSASRTLVTLPAELLFSTGSLTLREEASFALDLLATAVKLHPEVGATLVGHTDDDPPSGAFKRSYPSNWELSTARAAAVAHALIEKYTVPPDRLTIAGRAGNDPIATNDTPEGRAQNRRVVVHMIPTGATPQ